MKRLVVFLWLVTAPTAMLIAFQISDEVKGLEQQLKKVQHDILRDQEAIHVLEAEWSYLNRPAQIADLAGRHLDLGPLAAQQFVRLEDLPLRPDGLAQEGSTTGPDQAPATLVGGRSKP